MESHIEVVPNGVDLQTFHDAKPFPRLDFGFTDQDILLVYAGRIAPEKNLEFLLPILCRCCTSAPERLFADGWRGQKTIRRRDQIAPLELGMRERVHFVGMIPNEHIPSYLAMCDMFVTASVTEVHPFTVIEAMGTGLPILGIDSPGVGDSISDGETGLLATEDIASFTAKLTYLCMDSDLRKEMGRGCLRSLGAIRSRTYHQDHAWALYASHPKYQTSQTKFRRTPACEVLEEFLK